MKIQQQLIEQYNEWANIDVEQIKINKQLKRNKIELYYWDYIEMLNWNSDFDYKRIHKKLKSMFDKTELEYFIEISYQEKEKIYDYILNLDFGSKKNWFTYENEKNDEHRTWFEFNNNSQTQISILPSASKYLLLSNDSMDEFCCHIIGMGKSTFDSIINGNLEQLYFWSTNYVENFFYSFIDM